MDVEKQVFPRKLSKNMEPLICFVKHTHPHQLRRRFSLVKQGVPHGYRKFSVDLSEEEWMLTILKFCVFLLR